MPWTSRRVLVLSLLFAGAVASSRPVRADETAPAPAPAPESAPAPAPAPESESAPARYSMPWQLRPIAAANVVRSDTAFAGYENTARIGGFTVASTLLASFKIPGTGEKWAGLAPLLRVAGVSDSPPVGSGGFALVNPLLGATYAVPVAGRVRAGFFLGVTVPVGMGGGDSPNKGQADARAAGLYARSAMDNSLFAVNDFAVIPGVDIAWVGSRFTVQAEATLFQLWRVRGAAVQHEATKTNLTSGLHVGFFIVPLLSIGAELRYQRWLNAPIAVDNDKTGTLADNLTAAIGPRFHVPLGGVAVIHPGIAYAFGLDKPMSAGALNYHIIQLDIPVVF